MVKTQLDINFSPSPKSMQSCKNDLFYHLKFMQNNGDSGGRIRVGGGPLTIPGFAIHSTGRIPHVALPQIHVTRHARPAPAPNPLYCIRQTIRALRRAQVPHALRHTRNIPDSADPKRPAPASQLRQHLVPPAQKIHTRPASDGPTLVCHHRLVRRAEEGGVVVLDEAALELDGSAAGAGAEDPNLRYRSLDAPDSKLNQPQLYLNQFQLHTNVTGLKSPRVNFDF